MAVIPKGFRVARLQVLHSAQLIVNRSPGRTLLHQRLLVSKNGLLAWVDLALLHIQASLNELLAHLLNVFTFSKTHSNFALSSADVSDGVMLDSGIHDVLGTCNLSDVRGLRISGKA